MGPWRVCPISSRDLAWKISQGSVGNLTLLSRWALPDFLDRFKNISPHVDKCQLSQQEESGTMNYLKKAAFDMAISPNSLLSTFCKFSEWYADKI